MADDDHPFVDEEARKTSTIVTKNSIAIPEDRQKYKLSERAWNWEKIVDLFFRMSRVLRGISMLRFFCAS